MARSLSTSARRVQEALEAQGFDLQVVELPASTRTAAEAAEAIGCSVGQIAKSLIFRGQDSGSPILVIASGTNRVNEKTLAREGTETSGSQSPEDFASFIREDAKLWARLVRDSGAKLD